MKYFGGVEGGATHSHLVICDESGECCASATGPGTNHWMVGIPECALRIAEMINQAKADAKIPLDTKLTSLGLSLSGCEQESTNQELISVLRKTYPKLAGTYAVNSDTIGSILTASPFGGMVVISGTGSNALLRNIDGSTHSCGGWGHFLGDEGSAFFIAHRAMKVVFDDMDGFAKSPFSIERVWEVIQEHFNVTTRLDLLPHCYANFNKSFFASMCVKLVQLATDGDELSLSLFAEAGKHLGRAVTALLPKVQHSLVDTGVLYIVCVGSVWKSWELLREGFLNELSKGMPEYGLKLVTLTKPMAYGACYLGAETVKFALPRNYVDNFKVLYNIKGTVPPNGDMCTIRKVGPCNNQK